jgi:hypothetical protein
MAKTARSQHPSVVPVNRPGEGFSLDVKIDTTPGIGGKSLSFMGVNLATAPVPDRKFTADTCSVILTVSTAKFVFGQERIDGKGLRSAIVIQMSRNASANFVRICDSMSNPSVDEIAKSEKIPVERMSDVMEEPPQALTLSANMPLGAITGHEACIDFYQASPFAMGVVMRSQKLSLEPVVRIDLRTSLLIGLLQELRSRLTDDELNLKPEGKK